MAKKIIFTTPTLALSLISSAVADEAKPMITDRPDFTESTAVVPSGRTQIEGGITISRSGDEHSSSLGEMLVRHSLGQWSELRVEVPSRSLVRGNSSKSSDFGDGSLGFKVVLAPGSGFGFNKPSVALIGSASLPIGSRDARGSGFQPEAKLLLGVDLSERFSLSSNLNVAHLKDQNGHFNEFSASVSLGMGISRRTGAFVEFFGFLPSGKRDSSKYLNGGFTYLMNDDLQLDARLGLGIDNDVSGPDMFYGVGLAKLF
jgi:hypothetical protein